MSATIFWRPCDEAPPSFNVSAPSAFAGLMCKRFGSPEWEVERGDVDWMRGVRDATDDASIADWNEIIEAVEKHGRIRVWPQS